MFSFVSIRHFGALLLLLCVAVVLTNAQSPDSSETSSSSSSGVVKYPEDMPCQDNADRVSLHGEVYKMSPCSKCTCTNSTLSCEFETCQPTTCYVPLEFPEECCKWCPYNVTVSEVSPLIPGAQSIQEGRAENDLNVNLDVTYVNNREATSVKGQGLWQTKMWMSSQADGSTELPGTVVQDVLTEGQKSQDLLKRGSSTRFLINDIRYKVDMSDLTCDEARYLCAKFNKGENPETEKDFLTFNFKGEPTENALTGCSPIGDCKGGALVQVNNVAPMMQENTVVMEGNPNQVMVDLGVNYVDSDRTTDVTGQDLWTTSMWLSNQQDGSRPIRGTLVKEVLTSGQSSQALIKDPTTTFNINSIPYNFDLTGKTCSEAKYLCARFDKNKNAKASKEYSSFKFEGVPNTRALTGCSLIDNCRGVTFDDMTWSRDVGQLQYGLPAPLTIDAQVTTTADSPPVEGSRLWKMNLFGSRSVNGSGVRLNERSQILDGYNQAKSLAGGGAPLEFEDMTANYPLEELGCGEYKFLCLEFTKGDYARPDYTYATTSGKQSIIKCLPEQCRAVYVSGVNSELTSADLYEGRANNMVQFDTIVQTTDASSPVVGRNMWRLNMYGSESPDGSGPRQAPQEQVLSDYYSSRELMVPGSTLNFQPINTEFDMTNVNCKKLKYLCTEFSRNPESSEEFELNPVPDESVLRDCMEVSDEMCQGVVIDDMDWTMDILTDEVASGRPTPIRFDIDVDPRPNTGSASGENLWRIGMFGSKRPDGKGPRISPERQILTRDESSQDLTSGQRLRFSDVASEFDLSAIGCETEFQYLCLEYAKGLRAEPDFKFRAADGGEVVTKCKEQECRKGVKISGLDVVGNDNSVLRENEPYNRVMFDLTGITTPDSGGVDGDNLWDLKMYGSNYETGYGPRLNEQNVELNSYQRNKDVFPGEDIDFGMIDTNYNMKGLTCKDVRYLCAELSKNPRADPPFDLQPVPDRSVMKKCFPQKCDGIIVDNIDLGGDFIVDENTEEIELDVSVYSNPNSGDASGRGLWRLETFTANNRDGTGNRRMLERETLSPSEGSRELRSGSRMNFDNIAARINKDDIPCEEGGGYICVELNRGDAPSIGYSLSGTRPDSLTKCQKINCVKAVEAVPGAPGDRGSLGEPAQLPREWNQGPPGLPGPRGPAGYSGPNGYPGLSGVPGIKGPSGNSGPNGYPGSPGRPGNPGPPGEAVAPTYQQQYGSKNMGGYTGGYGPQQIVQGPAGPPGSPGKRGDGGAQGLRGNGGDSGPTGPAGSVGPAGPRGSEGDDGRDGSNGSPGSLGAAGPQGASGAMGANGVPGQQGHKGWRGARGRKGLRGDNGDAGDAGSDGAVGQVGQAGARGETGAPGARGDRGDRGLVGARGNDGDDGDAGAAGQQGGPGIRGSLGQSGFKGDAGATGDIGQPGIQGLLGEGGSDGAPGAAGAFGNPGKDGAAGAGGDIGGVGGPGLAGPAGARGSSGNRGSPGVGGEPGSGGYPGQPGARGLAGTRGARGITGPVGAAGSDGSDGSPGADGSAGPAGAAGPRGEAGSLGGPGPGGLPGPNGMQGNVGPQGAPGLSGEKGDTGAAGRNGNPGAPGQRGADGTEGRDGNDGKPGPAGSPGNDGKPGPQGASGVRGNRGASGPGGVAGQPGEEGRLGSQGAAGARGARGTTGDEGTLGPAGPTGATGARGDSGPQGSAGPIGPNGGVGMPGSRGAGGRRGAPGPAGNSGQGGAQGAPGERGPAGSMGLAGAAGEGGPSGPDGRDGKDGEPGDKGSSGDVGRIGVPGLTGAPGDRGGIGTVGNVGAPGAQGPSGKRGGAGGQGARGNPGPPGPAASPGLSGEPGDVGRSGRTGPQGPNGKQGEKGRLGERGTQGIPGGQGPQGLVGARGEKGSKGGVGDQGPEGGVGSDGRTGAPGATGAQGVRGELGEQGAVGAVGNLGPGGMPGPTGAPGGRGAVGGSGSNGRPGASGRRGGAGQQGAQGIRGVSGTQGQSGARGNDGRSGSVGPAGLAGPAGPLGILGELGGMGALGAPGPTGPAGRPGSDGSSGKRGASGSDGSTGTMGAQGAKGLRGPAGDEGRDGKDGPQGSQGATGSDGDKGPQGGQGSAGMAGIPGRHGPAGGPGERGSRGPAGPAGSRGSSGPDGNLGPAGPAGPAGARGETGATGITGHKGWGGSPGAPGGQGPKGPSGGQGQRGRPGSSGPLGIDGARGRNGKSGVQGPRGMAGSGGQRGPSGRVGPSGPPGAPGPAGAPGALSYSQGYAYSGPSSVGGNKGQNPYSGYYGDDAEIEEDDYEARIKQLRVRIMKLMLPNGEPEYPARSCKDIFKCYPYFPSGYYTLDPSGGSGYDKFVAYCDKKTNATCISPDMTKIPQGTYYLGDIEEPVDFSSMRNGSEIPYSVKPVQLTLLRLMYSEAIQNITYHCKNSHAVSDHRGRVDKAVTLIGSNDVRMNIADTHKDLQYNVEGEDGCQMHNDAWGQTTISYSSKNTERLPLVDFAVKDIGRSKQQFGVDIGPVCFF